MTDVQLVGDQPTARERKRAERATRRAQPEQQTRHEVTFVLTDGSLLPAGEMTDDELNRQRTLLDKRLGPEGDDLGRRTFQFRGSIIPARSVLRIIAEPL